MAKGKWIPAVVCKHSPWGIVGFGGWRSAALNNSRRGPLHDDEAARASYTVGQAV